MLSKKQWLWCAEHHSGIRKLINGLAAVGVAAYVYFFMETFWWNNKIPNTYVPAQLKFNEMKCDNSEVREMFIPSINKIYSLAGDKRDYVPDPLERHDARGYMLENYTTSVVGAEILEKRPECIGALIADRQHAPNPSALLIVDRETGKTIFRIDALKILWFANC